MKIQCPACNAEYEIETSLIGKHVECECGNKFDIPDTGVKKKHFKSSLAGSNYYLPALGRFLSATEPKIIIEFNPHNEYDPNAIQVLNAENRELLGHIEAGIAADISLMEGEAVKFEGKIISGRYGYNVDFYYFYLPPTIQERKDFQKQIEKLRSTSIHFLQDYVSTLQAAKMDYDEQLRERAETALALLDPDNSLIQDSKYIYNFANAQAMENRINESVDDPLFSIEDSLQSAVVKYTPKSTKPMFEFPTIDNVNANCRFAGKCVLFTGFYPEEKAQLAPIIDFLQIEQPAGVCRKLDFLICGSNAGPAKIKKAEALEKPIIQAADFIQEISGSTPDAQTEDLPPDYFQKELL